MRGVDHVGIGVVDMDRALGFYRSALGFTEVLFDYTGVLPGLDELCRHAEPRARVAMLASGCPTPLGAGRIKLVQLLGQGGTPEMPPGLAWGEVGICEVCVHAHDVTTVHGELVSAHGCVSLMDPLQTSVTPFDVSVELGYVADPDAGKIEILEWTGLWRSPPAAPRLEGVNHVAFGVRDMATTREFYRRLGFEHVVLESDGYFEPMRPWYQGRMPRQHIVLVLPGQGAGIEPVRLHPEAPDCRGAYGHAGPMEFAIGVTNLDRSYSELTAVGVRFHCGPQVVDVGTGEWRYAYFEDPDGLFVSLVETRY